jgi:hypothetical protein
MEIAQPEPSEPATSEPERTTTNKVALVFGSIILLGALALLGFLARAMLPPAVTLDRNPSVLDLIFANRWVILLIRIAGLALLIMFSVFVVYFVRSIAHRMRHGHWLRSGGPFEAEIVEKAGDALEDAEDAWELLGDAEVRNQELEGQLAQTSQAVENIYQAYTEASRQNEELRAQLEAAQEPPDQG